MSIKKIILPVLAVLIIGGFVVYKQFLSGPDEETPAINNNQQQTPPPTTQSGYKDGQYTGTVATSVYGDVQVKAVIFGGKITDIVMLKTPTGGGHTAELVASSFPILKSEAIAAQSAQVDVVSGATQNSEGFMQSLASALAKAV